MRHRYTIERRILTKDDGTPIRLSDYWRIVCRDCGWKGERVDRPGSDTSKDRWNEWRAHEAETD